MQSNAFKRWVNNVPNSFTPSRDFSKFFNFAWQAMLKTIFFAEFTLPC